MEMLRLFVNRGDWVVLKREAGTRHVISTRHLRGRQLQAAAKRLSPTGFQGSFNLPIKEAI